MAGIYVHVPFCKNKCTYCDFASYPHIEDKQELYFACLYKEIKEKAVLFKDKTVETIYFGGGTPSYVEAKYILGAVRQIKKYYSVTGNAEVTLEVNPATIDEEKLKIYKLAGINRFSIGLQTYNDKLLEKLNRVHNAQDYLNTVKLLKGYNLSVDIMIGLMGQDEQEVKKSLDFALCSPDIKHVSVYALKAEDGTPVYTQYLNGELPDGDEVATMYDFTVNYLAEKGYERYEVSNFAKIGFESKHNLNYWKRGEYLGFGLGASSFDRERRFTNTEKIDEYCHCILKNASPEIFSEKIEGDERKFEYAMLNLRTEYGVVFSEYEKAFGSDFKEDFKEKLKFVNKYLDYDEKRVKIKDEYLYVQNQIIIQLMD